MSWHHHRPEVSRVSNQKFEVIELIGNFEKAKKRVRNINWEIKNYDKPSHAVLVTEFIRRGNIFLDSNSIGDNRRAIFNAVEIIQFDVPSHIKENYIEQDNVNIDWVVEYLCTYYIDWAYAVEQEIPIALKFHDLYDPIIKLFERGGRIGYHHNELICGTRGWPRNSGAITRDLLPQDISDETLNALDANS